MYEEIAAFDQLTLSDFKNWSSAALKPSNKYNIIMTINVHTIKISKVWCCCLCCLFVSQFSKLLC